MNTPTVPVPRSAVTVRVATAADLPFVDSLQRVHSHMVGWMPTKQIEGKIGLGHVVVAEDDAGRPAGYCVAADRYFKRDDVGIVYQLNVVPERQRGLVGAALLRAVFERAAYGCRLFCCWCAQDLAANEFWEAMGFVPLAFRAGSTGKRRVHIFWQRRICAGDETTPYWYPFQTNAGALREDRIVCPIPPGTHWREVQAVALPAEPDAAPAAPRARRIAGPPAKAPADTPQSGRAAAAAASGGLRFARPGPGPAAGKKAGRPARAAKVRVKYDPKLLAAARELRDRYLEQVNADGGLLLLTAGRGKYDVTRVLETRPAPGVLPSAPLGQLPAPRAA